MRDLLGLRVPSTWDFRNALDRAVSEAISGRMPEGDDAVDLGGLTEELTRALTDEFYDFVEWLIENESEAIG